MTKEEVKTKLIELLENQLEDVLMMSKIELGNDVIKEIQRLKLIINADVEDNNIVRVPPFRVGRKNMRAVLDSKGNEVVIFPKGLESYAKEYVEFLNSKTI